MRRKTFLIFLAIFILSVSGCDLFSKSENDISAVDPGTEQANAKPTPTITSPNKTTAGGPCANKYFPVAEGLTRRYKVTSSKELDEYTYKINYRENENSFTETQSLKTGRTAALKIDWNCLLEGLQTASFAQITGLDRAGMTLESKKASGITLPKDSDWQAGKKWTSRYDLGGTFEMKSIKGDVTGNVVLDYEIKSLDEKITVPGGEFIAAKIETNLMMKASFRGMTIPSETLKMISWYAPEIGLVKHDVKGKMGNMLMEYIGK